MREHISTCLNLLEKENIVDQQVRWEYLKYAVRKFSIKCSKEQGKIIRLERVFREKKLKNLQNKVLKKNEKKWKILKDHSKSRAIESQVRADHYNDKETINETEIDNHICSFFKYFYKET